jgi:hypothetical protein
MFYTEGREHAPLVCLACGRRYSTANAPVRCPARLSSGIRCSGRVVAPIRRLSGDTADDRELEMDG